MHDKIARRIPWPFKIGLKLVATRLPIPYALWRFVGVSKHGQMLDAQYALGVFNRHYAQARSHLPPSYKVLELGPGDSLATSLIAATHGADEVFLVDHKPFASMNAKSYDHLLSTLRSEFPAPHRSPILDRDYASVSEILLAANAHYMTNGLESLQSIPTASVDFVFSQAVLEHVALAEFSAIISELYRLQRPGGIASHRIDFQDHLAHSLNSLRFSSRMWESNLFRKASFYTNRLRASQVVAVFAETGYKILAQHADYWPTLPISRSSLHPDYSHLDEEDLRVKGLDLLVQKG